MVTRRLPRLLAAAALVAMAAVVVPLALASDETITVPGTGSLVTSQAPLRKGMELVVSGTATDQYGCEYDAFYSEQCTSTVQPNQSHDRLGVDQIIKAGPASASGGPTKTLDTWLTPPYPAYQPSHVYHMTINTSRGAPVLGRAKFCVAEQLDNCADGPRRGHNFQGTFTLTLVNADAQEPAPEPETSTAPAPDPGKARSYPIPPPGAGANVLDGTLDFTDAKGNAIDSPLGVALRFHVGHAQEICWIFLLLQ